MKIPELKGCGTALVTPFLKDGEIDYLILTVGLAAFTGLFYTYFGQHIGIIGGSNLAQAVLAGTITASKHHELGICRKRDACNKCCSNNSDGSHIVRIIQIKQPFLI